LAMASPGRGFAFKRIFWSLVRDGTRLRTEIEGVPSGCFLTIADYVREVLEGRRETWYGVWVEDRAGSVPDGVRKRV